MVHPSRRPQRVLHHRARSLPAAGAAGAVHPVWARGGHVTDTWPLLYFVKHSLLVCVFTEETPFGWLKKTSCPSTGRRIGSAQKPSVFPPRSHGRRESHSRRDGSMAAKGALEPSKVLRGAVLPSECERLRTTCPCKSSRSRWTHGWARRSLQSRKGCTSTAGASNNAHISADGATAKVAGRAGPNGLAERCAS